MTNNHLISLLSSSFTQFIQHWLNTHGQGELADILVISVSDGTKRAKVITLPVNQQLLTTDDGQAVLESLQKKLTWAEGKFANPIKWLRLEWVTAETTLTWAGFKKELNRYKRNYFRSGVAFVGQTKPWCLLTEMELNANACLYGGSDNPVATVNQKNLEVCFKARHSSKNLPVFADDMPIKTFQTAGLFFDAETADVEKLCTLPRRHGHRDVPLLNADNTADLIAKTTAYLSNQVLDGGRFEYGYFPCFGRTINFYNTLRHASSLYSLLEGYQFCRDNLKQNQQAPVQLDKVAKQIELALLYLENNFVKHFGDKSYLLEENNTIKLGANAVYILALVKYMQVFTNSTHKSQFLSLATKLAYGIIAMQKIVVNLSTFWMRKP